MIVMGVLSFCMQQDVIQDTKTMFKHPVNKMSTFKKEININNNPWLIVK